MQFNYDFTIETIFFSKKTGLDYFKCIYRFDTNMYDIKVFFTGNGQIDDSSFDALWNEDTGDHIVNRVVFHPMYDHRRFHYDIAVLQLATSENTVQPIRLPAASRKFNKSIN